MRYLTERSKVVAVGYIKEYSVFEDIPDYDVDNLFDVIMFGYRDGNLPNVNKEAMESLYTSDDKSPDQDFHTWNSAQMRYNFNDSILVEVSVFHKLDKDLLDVRVAATSNEGYEHLWEYEYPDVNSIDRLIEILDSLFVTATSLAEDTQQDIDNAV